MRSSCRVGPESNDWGPNKRKRRGLRMRHGREGLVKMEAEVGINDASTSPGHCGLSATTRREE